MSLCSDATVLPQIVEVCKRVCCGWVVGCSVANIFVFIFCICLTQESLWLGLVDHQKEVASYH